MIKVELIKDDSGKLLIFFESNTQEEQDNLDKILEALVGPYPRRGAYVLGTPKPTLKVEINIGQ